jgi:serine/threonine protein phosphatase PrpC
VNRSLELLKSGGDTDTGLVREHNEDRLLLLPDVGVFAVVDGMGGESAGEKAAEIAVAVLKANFLRPTSASAVLPAVRQVQLAILDANNRIFEAAAANPEWSGMACVLTVAVIAGDKVVVGHVGDSRLYKLTRGQITKLTRDHSPVGVREDANEITEIQAMQDSRRHEVFRDVGSQIQREDHYDFADVFEAVLEPESALLLCSDGLTDMVTSARIHKIVIDNAGDPVQASRELIRIANEAGGRDNVSAIVIEGPSFKESVQAIPSRENDGHSVRQSLRPLVSRTAMFLYGAMAGIGLLVYLQWSSIGANIGLPWNWPQTIRVSPVEGDGAFTRISDALRAVRPGDRVEVAPGEYRESLVLPDGVIVNSTIPHGAIIRPVRVPATGGAIGILGEGGRVHISGFTILPGDEGLDVGIRLKDASVQVSNLDIGSATIAGIQIEGNTSGLIRGISVESGPETALTVKGANDVRVEVNWFGRSSAARATVRIEEGASIEILRNIIEGHAGSPPVSAPARLLEEITKNNHLLMSNSRP